MSNVTTLPKKEIETVSKQFSADTGYTYNGRLLHTVDDCVEQYNKADEVSRIAQSVIKDRMQGDALLKAKKLLPKHTEWISFLQNLSLLQNNGQPSVQVYRLLDFAGYKEAEENLMAEGIEIETIDTASHYREAKKLTNVDGHEAVATTYTQAVEANNGVKPSTAKEVKEVVNASRNRVSSEELFLNEYPEYRNIVSPVNNTKLGEEVLRRLPRPERSEWKSFYRLAAKSIHPDKGGTDEGMSILTRLNEAYLYILEQDDLYFKRQDRESVYEDWCADKGCEPYDWIKED